MELDVTYDAEADAVYIYLARIEAGGVAITRADGEGSVYCDFDHDGRLVGLEILEAGATLPRAFVESGRRIG